MQEEEIPGFNSDGNLPAGIYPVSWSAIMGRFGRSEHRKRLLLGLLEVLRQLKAAGCRVAYLDGSFVTRKYTPADFDLCYDAKGVDDTQLDPVFFDFTQKRRAQRRRFRGEIFSADTPGGSGGETYLDYFQICKRTKNPKGILALDLTVMTFNDVELPEREEEFHD